MRLIDADKFLTYLIYSKHIDGLTCGEVKEAVEMCKVDIEPQEKKGHREYNDIYDHYLCGNCKTIVMDYDNFCPNCGAKMESEV
jgi:hypothetical protein